MCEHGSNTIEGLNGSRHIEHFDGSHGSSINKKYSVYTKKKK